MKTVTLKAGKLEVIYNIKTFTIDTLVVSNSNTSNSIDPIKNSSCIAHSQSKFST